MFSLTAAEKQTLRRRQQYAADEENALRGHITRIGRGYYNVRSFERYESVTGVYTVDLNRSALYPQGHCTCKDFTYRRYVKGETCKHLEACLLWFGLEDCETPAEEEARRVAAASARRVTADDLVKAAGTEVDLVVGEAVQGLREPRFDTITTISLPAPVEVVQGLLDLAQRLTGEMASRDLYERFEIRPVVSTVNGDHVSTIGVVGVRKQEGN